VSSVLGPLAGALIVQHISWSWIFWINLPIGAVAAAGFALFLHETVDKGRHSVDVAGAALFTLAIASLMVALTEIGTSTAAVLWSGLVFAAAALLFVLQERRAAEPMLDGHLWAQRPILTANAATLLSGMAVIGLTAFLPIFVQGVMRQSSLVAGFTLTTMVFGWPVGATLAAKNFMRFGLKPILLFGAALLPLGAVVFVVLGASSSPAVAGLGSIVMGFGMGFLSTTAIVIIQDAVAWAQRGSATASNIFARQLGQTLGATLLGTVLNYGLAHPSSGPAVSSDQLRRLLDAPDTLAAGAADAVRDALGQSLHATFWGVFAIAVITLLLSFLVPRVTIAEGPRELAID
jgi:MFS family permease